MLTITNCDNEPPNLKRIIIQFKSEEFNPGKLFIYTIHKKNSSDLVDLLFEYIIQFVAMENNQRSLRIIEQTKIKNKLKKIFQSEFNFRYSFKSSRFKGGFLKIKFKNPSSSEWNYFCKLKSNIPNPEILKIRSIDKTRKFSPKNKPSSIKSQGLSPKIRIRNREINTKRTMRKSPTRRGGRMKIPDLIEKFTIN